MKIVHISTGASESSAVTRLHNQFLKSGIESYIITYNGNTDINNTYIYNEKNIFKFMLRKIKVLVNIAKLSFYRNRENIIFSLSNSGYNIEDLLNMNNINNADIIHIHWINGGFLNLDTLKNIKVPIVYTCHDSWAFTGGCHVKYNCERYKKNCGKCRILNSKKINDISKKEFFRKLKIYKNTKITFICPSNWMKNNLEASSLCKNNKIRVIGNTLDFNIFNIKGGNINIFDSNKVHILFGAVDAKDTPYKGYNTIIRTLQLLKEEKKELFKSIKILIFGSDNCDELKDIGVDFTCLGKINSQEKLAELYSRCDLLLYPSTEDNLPNVIMESLACGTPVVAFNIGGISDMVEHKKNGYLVNEIGNIKDLIYGIEWIIKSNINPIQVRNSILNKYNSNIIVEKHIQLYRELINNKI